MEFRIYAENDDGAMLHQATIDALSASDAIADFCCLYKLNNDGQFIALAAGESLPEAKPIDGSLKGKLEDGTEYDFE